MALVGWEQRANYTTRLVLNGSFFINYFTGPFGADPTKYLIEKELAGTTNVFAAPIQACDNCGRDLKRAVLVADTTDITPILLDYVKVGRLQSLGASDVVAFLKNRLKWRVVTVRDLNSPCNSMLTYIGNEPGCRSEDIGELEARRELQD